MRKTKQQVASIMIFVLIAGAGYAFGQTPTGRSNAEGSEHQHTNLLAQARPQKRAAFSLMPSFSFTPMAAGPNLPVLGSGTLGRLPKWTGLTSSNSFIGNSTIFEDKNGLVGIGTDTPTSKLTVVGTIESTASGFKFPDGTVQTTAGVAPNQVVRSLNGLMGDLTLVPGANIVITPGSNTVTISASGLLSGVVHDATLTGNGTAGSPLGVAVPLILTGSIEPDGLVQVTNSVVNGYGVIATGGTNGAGVFGRGGNGSGFSGAGVLGFGGDGGSGPGGTGLSGRGGNSSTGSGGEGLFAQGGIGHGAGNSGGIGIEANKGFGQDGATDGLAGKFNGDVEISGNLSVTGTKNFKIDHPLDPETKYLIHAAVESSEVLNIYSGNARLDANGEAIVELPEWLQAINREFRYSVTPIGAPASGLYIAQEITNGHFKIAGGVAGMKVSWQVIGVRSDRTLLKHPFKAEQEKPKGERGTYLNPEAFGLPKERGVEWARQPELRHPMKARR